MNSQRIAFVWRNGQIETGNTLPDGALAVVAGDAEKLDAAIAKTASISNGVAMVPGMQNIFGIEGRIDVLIDYKKKIEMALNDE